MISRIWTYITAMTVFAAVIIPVRLNAQEELEQKDELPRYTVTDLGTLGGTFSVASGINNEGLVAGVGNLPGDKNHHDFLWRRGVKTDLGTFGGPNSDESTSGGPNERGWVVGDAETATPDPLGEDFCFEGTHLICLPFLWQDGLMTQLPTLGGNNGEAFDINNRGQVVASVENTTLDSTCPSPQFQSRPALWENGEIHELPTFPGDPHGGALSINNKGQAVGGSGTCFIGSNSNILHALLWQDGTMTDLGSLGGEFNNLALNINDQGQVVGVSDLPGDTIAHAFLWQNGVMTDIGALPGDTYAQANNNNDKGQVVGVSMSATDIRAFLWQNGVMTDLNTLISAGSPLYLILANDINSRGEIVGGAIELSTGEIHAFLATPSHGGADSELAMPGVRSETTERPKIIFPENIRRLLQQRLGFGRFRFGLMRPQ